MFWPKSIFLQLQKWPTINFWIGLKSLKPNIFHENYSKNFFREIDLFDFTSFFGLDFFKFSDPLWGRLTPSWMAVKTINTKVIRRFMLNLVLYYHFSEKQLPRLIFNFLRYFVMACLAIRLPCRWLKAPVPKVWFDWCGTCQKCWKSCIKSWTTFLMVVFQKNGNLKHDSA